MKVRLVSKLQTEKGGMTKLIYLKIEVSFEEILYKELLLSSASHIFYEDYSCSIF